MAVGGLNNKDLSQWRRRLEDGLRIPGTRRGAGSCQAGGEISAATGQPSSICCFPKSLLLSAPWAGCHDLRCVCPGKILVRGLGRLKRGDRKSMAMVLVQPRSGYTVSNPSGLLANQNGWYSVGRLAVSCFGCLAVWISLWPSWLACRTTPLGRPSVPLGHRSTATRNRCHKPGR